jgi:SAM-dependent methyltransferase
MATELTCAICGGLLGRALLTINHPDRFERRCGISSDGYHRSWVECTSCGTATNVLPAASAAALEAIRSAYYEVDFASDNIGIKYSKVISLPPGKSDNWGRVDRIIKFLARWQKQEGTKRRVLDIGAGTGVFLSRFLDAVEESWEAVAVEPDPIAASHLRSLGRFEVVEGFYQGQTDLRGFDLVTLNKVLEHISEPLPLLRSVVAALAPGMSILYLELPDKLTIGRRAPEDNILGALHCHLYTPSGVLHLLREAGFEALSIERIVEPSGKITIFAFACLPQALSDI